MLQWQWNRHKHAVQHPEKIKDWLGEVRTRKHIGSIQLQSKRPGENDKLISFILREMQAFLRGQKASCKKTGSSYSPGLHGRSSAVACNMISTKRSSPACFEVCKPWREGSTNTLYTKLRGFAESRWQTDRTTRCPEETMMAQQFTHSVFTPQMLYDPLNLDTG